MSEKNANGSFVGTEAEIKRKRRETIEVESRKITVFYHNEQFYALDYHCYHAGGPLDMGDIEDINGVDCIVCPWHKYKISLKTGEGWYRSVDPKQPSIPPYWRSKGTKQRTHTVFLQDGRVYVKLSDLTQPLESDYYYSQRYKQLTSMVMSKN